MAVFTLGMAPDLKDHGTEAATAPPDGAELFCLITPAIYHVHLIEYLLRFFQADGMFSFNAGTLFPIVAEAHRDITVIPSPAGRRDRATPILYDELVEAAEFITRLLIAMALGSAIGVERQVSHHLAGLKTNALVSTGAALFMVVAAAMSGDGNGRIAGQIVTGIGFLGGGVILRDGFHVRGLNTAATLWCAAAVGTLAGVGLLMQAAVGTAVVLAINVGLRPISARIGEEGLLGLGQVSGYQVRMVCRMESEAAVRTGLLELAQAAKLDLRSMKTEVTGTEMLAIQAEFAPTGKGGARLEELVQRAGGFEGVSSVEWKALA